MSKLGHHPRSLIENDEANKRIIDWPKKRPGGGHVAFSAYNRSREQFLASDVELVDLSPETLYDRLATITPESKTAFWLAPFHGISPDRVSSPIDLVYLDRNYCVLEAVESFPISQPTPQAQMAETVLALPAQAISSSGTAAQDQLILGSPQTIKSRLRALEGSSARALEKGNPSSNPSSISHNLPPTSITSVKVSKWEDLPKQNRLPELAPAQTSVQAPPALLASKQKSSSTRKTSKTKRDTPDQKKSWLARWLEPPDPRYSQRESLPWIVAYFFNGGAPTPNTIRDISLDGMFLYTSERWYPGTVIRVTLSDRRLPSAVRSIAVNAMAVRSDEDGVGLCFIFEEEKPRKQKSGRGNRSSEEDGPLVNVTQKQLKEFLERSE